MHGDNSMQAHWSKLLIRGIYMRKGIINLVQGSDVEDNKSIESSVSSLFAPHYYREFKMSKVVEKSGVLKTAANEIKIENATKSMFGAGFGKKQPSAKPLALRKIGTIVPRNSNPQVLEDKTRKQSIKSNARSEIRVRFGNLASTIAESEISDNANVTE